VPDPPPVLAASALRVDVGGSPAIDGLTLATTGDRVLVLGAARALFEVAAGLRAPSRGEVRVEGVAPRAAVSGGIAACAPLDPPMPPAWTVLQYVTWSARLAGHPKATARGMAGEALERMHLGRVAGTKLGGVAPATRRGTVLAAALATGARTLLVEDPLPGLPSEAARPFARVLARTLDDHRVAIFAGRMPLESPLALAADEALVIDRAEVSAQGAPAELAAAERTLALRVQGDVAAFARAVEAGGGHAEVTIGAPPPVHVRVELGPLSARDLLRIAEECRAMVVELRPLARAFA
jgi:ABC-type multidrug transport system ATPase subunit